MVNKNKINWEKVKVISKKKKYKYLEQSVLWYCRQCGAYNLHPIDWEEFDCINCKTIYKALASEETIKEEIK